MKLDGVRLQSEIACQQMTITDLARKAGLPTSTIYRAINLGRSNTRTVGKIAAALSVNPNEIFHFPAIDNASERRKKCR